MNQIDAILSTVTKGKVLPMVRQEDILRMQVPLLSSPEGVMARFQLLNGVPSVILRTKDDDNAVAVPAKTIADIKDILEIYRTTLKDPNCTTMLQELP